MSILRRIDDPCSWAEHAESTLLSEGDCPGELLRQAIDTRGISVFCFNNDFELWRCIAALSFSRIGLRDVTCAIFSEEDVRQRGLTLRETKGITFDKHVNSLHRDLADLTLARLGGFIRLLCRSAEIKVFPKKDIIEFVNRELNNSTLKRRDIFHESEQLRFGEILLSLWDNDSFILRS